MERLRAKRGRHAARAAVVVAGLALIASGCRSAGHGGTSTSTTSSGSGSKTFAVLKVVFGTTDHLDPGLSDRVASWQIFQDVYLGLLGKQYVSCSAGDCTKIIPVLAQSLPVVNRAGTDFTFTLRKGLKYSNGDPVMASDFKSTIIRDFKLHSPGIGSYANIVGAAACENNPTTCSGISGIVANDQAGTIEIKLSSPESDFEYVLTRPYSALLPGSTPAVDTESPPPAADGPYVISSYTPGQSFVLRRNPDWKPDEIPGVPNGNPDKIEGTLTDDASQSAQDVINGTADYDENLLPETSLASLVAKHKSQIKYWATPSTYYFFMNESLAPFDSLDARKALNYAIDRRELVNLRGGLGVVAYNFLPPTYPQYRAIAPTPYPYDLAKAKELVTASGTAGQTVGVWTIRDGGFDQAAGIYLARQLRKIGWKTQLHAIDGLQYYAEVGRASTRAQTGFADWFEDFPYPSDWFGVLENGASITPTGSNNLSHVDIPAVNHGIDQLDHVPSRQALSPAVNSGWAALDRALIVRYASEAPFLNAIQTSFFSSRMNPKCDVFDDSFDDLAQMCLK